jgi:uncharacterized protein
MFGTGFYLDKIGSIYILENFEKGGDHPLKIRVEDVKKKAVDLTEDEPAAHYPSLAAMEQSGEAVFTAPVHSEVSAIWEFGHVRVSGRVESNARLTCSRCLTEYELPLASDFTIFYTQSKGEEMDEEVELSDEELISASYTGDEIEVDPEIAEQVMMEVPYKPLCNEACKGLCPQCGADLNAGECGCDRGPVNLKMAALKKLKIEK